MDGWPDLGVFKRLNNEIQEGFVENVQLWPLEGNFWSQAKVKDSFEKGLNLCPWNVSTETEDRHN
jgi:hypothetical protein